MRIPPESSIHLLHEARLAVLATHSTNMPGHPYASAVPLVVDHRHRPLLLVSALAEHTKNLLTDPRASLSVIEPGQLSVQNAARMTLIGRFEQIAPDAELYSRYHRYELDAETYLQLDFLLFSMHVQRTRFIGGVGKMGWLEESDWDGVPCLASSDELSLLDIAATHSPPGIRVLGVDAYGLDYEAEGVRERCRFGQAYTADRLATALPEIVRGFN